MTTEHGQMGMDAVVARRRAPVGHQEAALAPSGPPLRRVKQAAAVRGVGRRARDAEAVFGDELGRAALLDPAEEASLARDIARARRGIRALLRRARRLTRLALASAGRGVVDPQRDFREREALTILRYAEAAQSNAAALRAMRMQPAQVRAFAHDLSEALVQYRLLRDRMLCANLRLVAAMARRHHHPTLTYLDLVQEGAFGLLRAVEKFEPARGVRFSTYAAWWISQQLGRTADTQGALIRTPVHWNQMRRRLGRSANGEAPATQWATDAHIDQSRLAAMTQSWHMVSTDTASEDSEYGLPLTLVSEAPDPETLTSHAALGQRLERAVDGLPARERSILRQRFGLDGGRPRTLAELSVDLGVSRERVRQLETRGLARLKSACAAQGLRDYLN